MSALQLGLIIGAVALVALLLAWWRWNRRRIVPTPTGEVGLESIEAVVLAHGLLGFDSIQLGRARHAYFRGIRDGLERAGVPTYASKVAPLGSVPDRAEQLAAFVRSLPHESIILIGHSMGGLDARYAIAKLGLSDRVRMLITVGTPHRGSPLADLANRGPARVLRDIAARFGLRSDAIDWLTTDNLEAFNRDVLDHPDVAYFSVVGQTALGKLWRNPLLLGSSLFLQTSGGANDGLVTVESQHWGETLDEIDADHFDQIGWSLRSRATALYIRWLRRATSRPLADDSRTDAKSA